LNGANDYVLTDFVLNPAQGPFGAFLWVKGGLPGQVVMSQAGGADWLGTHPTDGSLMTELKYSGRSGSQLRSQTAVADERWHHVGLVWDPPDRVLYVDGIEVARDTQADLAGSEQGLRIGAGASLTAGSFWRGLLDDVRIYDYALSADDVIAEAIVPALGLGPAASDFDGNGTVGASDLATFSSNWLRCYRLLPDSCWRYEISVERDVSLSP
jgi:hypothetical protein